MPISVRIYGGDDRTVRQVEGPGTVLEILSRLGLSAQEYVAAVADTIVPVDHEVGDGDDVALIRMTSGG